MKDTEVFKISTKIEHLMICDESADIAFTEFRDKYLIIISNNGKIGTLVQVSHETAGMETFYDSKVLFGRDKPEINAVACAVAEMCKLLKPVVFGFSLKSFTASTAADLRNIICEMVKKAPKEDSANVIP